jgi:Ca2+-binding EF-hand superfamily protein
MAASIAALVGSVTLAGIGFAERGEPGRYERHGHRFKGGEHGDHHGERHRGERLFESFDRNDDGKLTQAEVDQTRRDRFAQFDADKDGKLTLQEYQVLWLDAMRNRMVDRFQSLDDDGDAAVTSEEFLAPFGKVVSRRDRDDNGELTRDEMRKR